MKIESNEFCVREGAKVRLKKWPTKVKPFYKSKAHYQKLLEEAPDYPGKTAIEEKIKTLEQKLLNTNAPAKP